MKTCFLAGLPLFLGSFTGFASQAMTSQELCARVYEQYGVRTEECDLGPAHSPASAKTDITAEQRESHVFFERGGTTLDDEAKLQLAILVQVLEAPLMQRACLRLIGHSDTSGSAVRNQEIALQRAQVVAEVLRAGLQDDNRIRDISSEGETRPIPGVPGNSGLNRRVEIQAKDCPN